MMIKSCVAVSILAGAVLSAPMPVRAQDVPAEYQQVLSTLGKQGDFKDNVLKVNIPRNDVKMTVAAVATPTPSGDPDRKIRDSSVAVEFRPSTMAQE